MPLARATGLAFATLAVVFLISLTYRVREMVDRIDEMRHASTIAQFPFFVEFPSFTVTQSMPEAGSAGIRVGDKIIGVNGRPLRGTVDLVAPIRDARAGDTLTFTIDSGGERRSAAIVMQPMRRGPPSALEWLYFGIVNLAMPCLCMALGFWVAAVRIHDKQAWLLLAMLLSLAEFVGGEGRTLYGRDDAFQPIAVAYQQVLANLWPTTMMLFGIYFSGRLELDRRYPWLKWIVIAPILVRVAGTSLVTDLLVLHDAARAAALAPYVNWLRVPVACLQLAAMVAFFAAMAYKTVTAANPDARRRLLLLDAAALVSILPIIVFMVLIFFRVITFQLWLVMAMLVALFIFPLTMAYVIVVHRAMDVRVVIRQGLQYVFARGSVRVVQVVLSVLIVAAAATIGAASNPINRLLLIAGGLAMVVLIQAFAERLRRWVDRRFFREAYDAEQVLSDLAARVRTMVETGPLLETVARRVSETLHVPRVAIMLNGGGTLQPAYALGYPQLPDVAIPHGTLTAATERELQETLASELLLPLTPNQKLIGVMSLGPKQSEEPFSSADIRMLDALAAHTGLALENSRLTAEIAAEVARREKAKRELEIAREVQERLFPQEYPAIDGLDYAGACRPALGVGGDYYDFIRLSPTRLGIAIGDVSGKGIPAALLMATLRAYLRGQTIRGNSDLAAMMANLNELVFESSASNRYATFFYGEYDAATRVFHYVNAGHNPPLVFRHREGDVLRLAAGGPVIGLIQGCAYTDSRITLAPGDLVVAFTDGVSEAMNTADEEWGEEGLLQAAQANLAAPARQQIDHLMSKADAFVAGAPQHDDMTVVVVRLTEPLGPLS